jgi:hypothetical protein
MDRDLNRPETDSEFFDDDEVEEEENFETVNTAVNEAVKTASP